MRRGVLVERLLQCSYFINTVGRHGSEEAIRRYVQEQGTERDYKRLYSQQMELF